MTIGSFDKTILNSLSAHIAILDSDGHILETNTAWQLYGQKNGMRSDINSTNINYLKVCDQAHGKDAEFSQQAADGMRRVIKGDTDEFTMEYPCHSPTMRMWFYMRVTRIKGNEPYFLVVSHENITPLKLAEEKIRNREEELRSKSQNLEELNSALKVLLHQRDKDRQEIEERIVANVNQMVFVYLEKMKNTRLDSRQKTYLDIIETHLNDIISPFLQTVTAMHLRLTPQEIQVATLVKEGKTTKEIADLLSITTNAIDFHRKNIRRKFGLNHQKTNLRSFLLSLS